MKTLVFFACSFCCVITSLKPLEGGVYDFFKRPEKYDPDHKTKPRTNKKWYTHGVPSLFRRRCRLLKYELGSASNQTQRAIIYINGINSRKSSWGKAICQRIAADLKENSREIYQLFDFSKGVLLDTHQKAGRYLKSKCREFREKKLKRLSMDYHLSSKHRKPYHILFNFVMCMYSRGVPVTIICHSAGAIEVLLMERWLPSPVKKTVSVINCGGAVNIPAGMFKDAFNIRATKDWINPIAKRLNSKSRRYQLFVVEGKKSTSAHDMHGTYIDQVLKKFSSLL